MNGNEVMLLAALAAANLFLALEIFIYNKTNTVLFFQFIVLIHQNDVQKHVLLFSGNMFTIHWVAI